MQAFWLITCAGLCQVSCSILGCFLVLRRLSMIGDAITHAVLPGLAVAFYVTQSVDSGPMFVGALVFGLLTAILTEMLGRSRYLAADAAMGVVFTILFALGVLLIDLVTKGGKVHLDVNCVLEGELVYILFDMMSLGGVSLPSVLPAIVIIMLLTLGFVGLFWKELTMTSFDQDFAYSQGFSPVILHYGLMLLVSGVAVTAFRLVGSILVVAMLIVPAATAQLLTTSLRTMLGVSCLLGLFAVVLGYFSAIWMDTNVSGMISVCSGVIYGVVLCLAPGNGLLARLKQRLEFQRQVMSDDILLTCYRVVERHQSSDSRFGQVSIATLRGQLRLESWWDRILFSRSLHQLMKTGALDQSGFEGVTITAEGLLQGQKLIRGHRLWESFLDEKFLLPPDHVHEAAERIEHYLHPGLQTDVAGTIEPRDVDPQGKTIPPDPRGLPESSV